jgi:predicted lipoprotein with Yx(FWY)xxD motif
VTSTSRTSGLLAALALGTLGLAACGGSGGGGVYGSSGTTGSTAAANSASTGTSTGTSSSTMAVAALRTASTSLGTVVVDGAGMTVYEFDKDTKGSGTSACSGGCLKLWPAVPASGTPTLTGVSGTVGTITRDDGTTQVTLNGHPLYTYANDAKAGDVTGQGVGGIWWVVGPDGSEMTAGPSTSTGY